MPPFEMRLNSLSTIFYANYELFAFIRFADSKNALN